MWFNGYPALKAAAPQDNDPATQTLRGPNSLKTTKSKTDTKTTGSGKQSPPDVNTDVMRGFHNPDYQEKDTWVRNLEEKAKAEDVTGDIVSPDDFRKITSNNIIWEAFSWIPFIGFKDDASAGEFEVGKDNVYPWLPDNAGFSATDIHHVNLGVILDARQLIAHGGGNKEQQEYVRQQLLSKKLISLLTGKLIDGLGTSSTIDDSLGWKDIMDAIERGSSTNEIIKKISSLLKKDVSGQRKEIDSTIEQVKKTQKYLSSLRVGDIYYRVSLNELHRIKKEGTMLTGLEAYSQAPIQAPAGAVTTQSEALMYFRKENGKERLMFILLEDTMEILWP